MWGLGLGDCFGFRVQGLGFFYGVQGLGLKGIGGSGFGV